MNEAGTDMADSMQVEDVLAQELAYGDVVLGTLGPILGHLLSSHAHTLFNDRIIAQIRGMISNLATQFVMSESCEQGEAHAMAAHDGLVRILSGSMSVVSHCHALAIEGQLTERLHTRNAIDPVLPSLVQSLIASEDDEIAETAMGTLAAQARFIQHQSRMELPVHELPQDIFDAALGLARDLVAVDEVGLRDDYNPGGNRLALLERLTAMVENDGRSALTLNHAGTALFLTALASISGQSRDLIVVSTDESQLSRLTLAMRAAGLKPHEIEEQFLLLHPMITLPDNFDSLKADRAAQLLSGSDRQQLG